MNRNPTFDPDKRFQSATRQLLCWHRVLSGLFFFMLATLIPLSDVYAQSSTNPGSPQPGSEAPNASQPARWYDDAHVQEGKRLYQHNCAVCHGVFGEGATNWRQRGTDGRMPPPPLNGTGHTWHHPGGALMHVIENGSPGGAGNMPGWKGKLTRPQMAALIARVQAWWSDEIYARWFEIEMRSRQ